MPSPLPTSLAVADAITHYRQLRELTRDELAYVLMMNGYHVTADRITQMEDGTTTITVDDLMAIAYALDTTPAVMLTHIPIDMPYGDGPMASGLPADIEHCEVRPWIEGRTELDHDSRVRWWQERVARLQMAVTHCHDQVQGAYAEKCKLGELVQQEEESPTIQRLYDRIRDGEYAFNQSQIALAMAEQQLETLLADA